jgi:hypothetical protein
MVSLLGGERDQAPETGGAGGLGGVGDIGGSDLAGGGVGAGGVGEAGAAGPGAGDGGTGGAGAELPPIGLSDNTSVPEDPVLARLFPDAYHEDNQAAAEFRRYTEVGLREGKIAAATAVLDGLGAGGEIVLDSEQAQDWLRALNDLRLALGTRLEITEEMHEKLADLDPDDPHYPAYAAYDWLSFLQESLVRALW